MDAQIQFFQSFVEMQKDLEPVDKSSDVSFNNTSYSFAPLDEIQKSIKPILHKHGFAVRQELSYVREVGNGIRTVIMHKAGHFEESFYKLPEITKDDCPINIKTGERQIEKISTILAAHITYFKRYALCAALGIICCNEDNDGQVNEEAKVTKKEYPKSEPAPEGSITDQQWKNLWEHLKGNYTLIKALKTSYGIEDLKHLPETEYEDVMLLAKNKKQ